MSNDQHNKGTLGRVYGGNPNLIHIDDGTRAEFGHDMAGQMDGMMRERYTGERTEYQLVTQRLCPGCYMIGAFNMLLTLADGNGQSRLELARSMKAAFEALEANPEMGLTEEIIVKLDPCDEQ